MRKGLVLVTAIAVAAAAGVGGAYVIGDPNPDPEIVETTQTETEAETTTTAEVITGLGANVIEDLLDSGSIDEAASMTPEDGWTAEYEVEPGQTTIRFRKRSGNNPREVEWESWNDRVFDAINAAAVEHGYTEEVE